MSQFDGDNNCDSIRTTHDEIPTPRTDKELWYVNNPHGRDYRVVSADFARHLERELAAMTKQYYELIMEVAQKFDGETRHETALRYIRERETITPPADASPSS